jgi:uncharacterized OsmC-like protein
MRAPTRRSVVAMRQESLRDVYACRPQEALTRKTARTSSGRVPATDPFHGEVEVGEGFGSFVRFGLDRNVGGLHDAPNPGDLLCAALAACADGTIRMLADLLGIELVDLQVEVGGDVDVRGCLDVDRSVKVGFDALDCRIRVRASEGTAPARLRALVAAGERYCVNLDTLRNGIAVRVDAGT